MISSCCYHLVMKTRFYCNKKSLMWLTLIVSFGLENVCCEIRLSCVYFMCKTAKWFALFLGLQSSRKSYINEWCKCRQLKMYRSVGTMAGKVWNDFIKLILLSLLLSLLLISQPPPPLERVGVNIILVTGTNAKTIAMIRLKSWGYNKNVGIRAI